MVQLNVYLSTIVQYVQPIVYSDRGTLSYMKKIIIYDVPVTRSIVGGASCTKDTLY